MQTMMLDDMIVMVLLLSFVGVITAIRLKARAQRAEKRPAASRTHERGVRGECGAAA
jgi:hypothetical protein